MVKWLNGEMPLREAALSPTVILPFRFNLVTLLTI
jgi:hypothetical protein